MIFSKLWKLKVCQVHQDLQDLRRGNCRVGGCRRHHRQVIRSHHYRHHRHLWRFHQRVSRSCCKNIYPLLLLLLARYNIEFVKINNKKYARGWGIRSLSWFCLWYFFWQNSFRHFPAVSFFKAGAMMVCLHTKKMYQNVPGLSWRHLLYFLHTRERL